MKYVQYHILNVSVLRNQFQVLSKSGYLMTSHILETTYQVLSFVRHHTNGTILGILTQVGLVVKSCYRLLICSHEMPNFTVFTHKCKKW